MRRPFIDELISIAQDDPNIVLLTGDLGYTVLEPFQEAFPDRFFNVGVAEQNMVGMATGMAEAGLRPFVYSIAPFAVLRPFEFFRNGAVFQSLPVCLVGVGGGVEYSHEGGTHFALEDIAVLRPFQNVRILAPCEVNDARVAARIAARCGGPSYVRLGKDEKWQLPGATHGDLSPRLVREGEDVLIACLGPAVRTGLAAGDLLRDEGLNPAVASVTSFHGAADEDGLSGLLEGFSCIVTVEEHFSVGGLGSAVAEVIAEAGSSTRLTRCGFGNELDGRSGSHAWWMERSGLSPRHITDAVMDLVAK